jgi:SNF2 family DNA or RNA helicase
MASADHIDLTSSSDAGFDSESDEEDWDLAIIKDALDNGLDQKKFDSFSNQRSLPRSITGHGGVSSSNGRSSRPNMDRHFHGHFQARPSSSGSVRIADSFPDVEENFRSRANGASVPDSGNISLNHGVRRSLPSSIQPSFPSSRSSGIMKETHGNPYHSALQSQSYGTNYSHFGRVGDSNRVLPPSMMHSKSVTNAMPAGPGDPMMHRTIVEERVGAEHDERLVYQAALQDLNQPKIEANLPDGLLSVSLLRHQKIALAWMLQKETSSLHCLGGILADDQGLGKTISMIALIQMQKSLLSKSKPEGETSIKTEALNLDEDDDNGTIIIDKPKQDEESVDVKPQKSTPVQEFRTRRPAAGTLVVCPASVLRQWAQELEEKVADEAKLDVLIYHGGNRTKDPVELAKYDVVLTTYALVTNEVPKQPLVDGDDEDHKDGEPSGLASGFNDSKKRKNETNGRKKGKKGKKGIDSSSFDSDSGTLARVGWNRVILDEAQTIKNHRTLVARACCGLRAKRRWCLSGTPIQNSIEELFSYFRFLRYDPYASYKSFCSTIKIPISRNSSHGYKKLQAVLRAIMLRRTKGTYIDGEPIINLPKKHINLPVVEFSPEERAFYMKLEADSRNTMKEYAAAGTLKQNYANILLMLLRLRQACDHPLLVKGFRSDAVEKLSTKMAKRLPRDMQTSLLSLLETSPICNVCKDSPEDPVVTMCRHIYCFQCISEGLTGEGSTCPTPHCKENLGSDSVFSQATLRDCLYGEDGGGQTSSSVQKPIIRQEEHSSSKIRAAINYILKFCRAGSVSHVRSDGSDEGPIKAIIFSQWTKMLDLIEYSLNEALLQYRRLDGKMSLNARDKAVKEFNTDPEVTVMLMSLKAGNLGLNMVAASHVILMDLWWNPTTEDQAIDRAHRIGQTRPVTVTRMTIKDTVEDRILALQEEKRKMVASAFGDDPSGGTTARLTVEDLRYLFML